MNRFKLFLCLCFSFVFFGALNVFAAGDVSDSLTTAFTAVKTDAMAVLEAVGPIAIGIVGVFLVWKLGIRFFKGLVK